MSSSDQVRGVPRVRWLIAVPATTSPELVPVSPHREVAGDDRCGRAGVLEVLCKAVGLLFVLGLHVDVRDMSQSIRW